MTHAALAPLRGAFSPDGAFDCQGMIEINRLQGSVWDGGFGSME